jgi:Taurine catabolism dioxygenase TauD, TfdA family
MTPTLRLVPQFGPAVWTGAALTPNDWMVPLGAEAAYALAAAVAARPPDRSREAPRDVPLAQLGPLLQAVANRLEHGRGFALLRGLTLERLGAAGAEAALLLLAGHIGTLLPQDGHGTLIGSLVGPGADCLDGAGDARPIRFHADPADAVALFCLRQPARGGSVTLVSAPALHNALLRADRAALAVLHGPLPHGGSGGDAPAMRPVFSTASGAFVGRYERDAMPDSLDPAQFAALAALDAAAAAPGQALAIPLHAGDLLLYNPHLVWKRAMPGEHQAPPGAERELLRLWLATPNSRALPESFRPVFGETAAGVTRGGVPWAAGRAAPGPGAPMVGG